MGIQVKAIDYVEIDEKAVQSYNAMFQSELPYKTQSVVGWNLKPDVLIHGSPCTQVSIAGYISPAKKPKGLREGSGTESSLMWETIHIIRAMGKWKPKVVIWENVKNVRGVKMIDDYNRYLKEMEDLGYTNSYACLDARDFGIPQARKRVFTISCLNGIIFDFDKLRKHSMKPLSDFSEDKVDDVYIVTQPSILSAIGVNDGSPHRARILEPTGHADTITERQDRCPTQVIDIGNGKYRFLTEKECWRLMGYSDEDFHNALRANPTMKGKKNATLYRQAGNSICVPIFESIFEVIFREVLKCK